jgi:hypothetical protein
MQVSQTMASGRFVHCLLFPMDAMPGYVLFQYDPVWLSCPDQVASHYANGQTYDLRVYEILTLVNVEAVKY